MYANVVFVIRCLYSVVCLTLVREQRFIIIIIIITIIIIIIITITKCHPLTAETEPILSILKKRITYIPHTTVIINSKTLIYFQERKERKRKKEKNRKKNEDGDTRETSLNISPLEEICFMFWIETRLIQPHSHLRMNHTFTVTVHQFKTRGTKCQPNCHCYDVTNEPSSSHLSLRNNSRLGA